MTDRLQQALSMRLLIELLVNAKVIAKGHIDTSFTVHVSEDAHQHAISQLAKLAIADQTSLEKEILTESLICRHLAKITGFDYFVIDPLKIDVSQCTAIMSFEYAQRHQLLPVKINDTEVVIATSDPFQTGWQEAIKQVTRKNIATVIATPTDVARYCTEFYSLARSISGAVAKKHNATVLNFEQLFELGSKHSPEANDEDVVQIVDWILEYAYEQRASDIHIEPRRDFANIRFRIDGLLHSVYQMPVQVGVAVTSRLKILGRMNVAEKRKPQDGRIKSKFKEGLEVELRLSTLPSAFGEKLVLRLFDPEVLLRSYEQLGLEDSDLKQWRQMTGQANGIIFVTGPTGSGKTTTLYSTLKDLATEQVNVCTIEDPIEMVEASFNQMQVQPQIDLGFKEGVQALLRQDPDIIMIGEIRSLEMAQMAVQAALTGHLVLSTLHTNDAIAAITRLQDLGIEPYLIRSTLLGVMAQRLVRTLCENCKQAHKMDNEQWQSIVHPWKMSVPKTVYKACGCIQCRNTGYTGRTGIYELFTLNDQLASQLSNDSVNMLKFKNTAVQTGMKSLRLSGALKVAKGITSVDEVLRVAPLSHH